MQVRYGPRLGRMDVSDRGSSLPRRGVESADHLAGPIRAVDHDFATFLD